MSSDVQPQGTEPKSGRISIAIAVIAAILTPGAYLLGLSYYQGYLSAFGVESDGFPISAPDIYVFSYQTVGYFLLALGELSVNAIKKIFSPPFIYWVSAILIVVVGVIYLLLRLARNGPHPRIQRVLSKVKFVVSRFHWKNNDFTKSVGIVGVASYSAVLFITSVAAIALFWWLLPLSAYYKGHSVAQERIKIFMEKGCHEEAKTKWDTCFVVLDEKGAVIHEGLLIAINDKEMAFFKKNGSYVFPRKDDAVLRRKLH